VRAKNLSYYVLAILQDLYGRVNFPLTDTRAIKEDQISACAGKWDDGLACSARTLDEGHAVEKKNTSCMMNFVMCLYPLFLFFLAQPLQRGVCNQKMKIN
jgi:hypothetical protein